MRIKQSIEQGIYVVLMLALEKEHKPVKSNVLSSILGVSDSYLKKILRKMVVSGIVTSSASKDGGYQLARSIEEITLYDIYQSIVESENSIELSGLAHKIFVDDEKLKRDEEIVMDAFGNAFHAFNTELKKVHLSELLIKENYLNGWTEWNEHVK